MFDESLLLEDPLNPIEMPTILFRPDLFNSLPAEDRLSLWRESRAVTIWNQRAALLKAVNIGLQGPEGSDAEREIELINNWFSRKHYNSNIDASTGQAVTPVIDPARLQTLADQNRQAAQDIAASAVAADLVRIGTQLANIARQNVGGPLGSGSRQAAPPSPAGSGVNTGGDATELLTIAAAAAAAAFGALALARIRRLEESLD